MMIRGSESKRYCYHADVNYLLTVLIPLKGAGRSHDSLILHLNIELRVTLHMQCMDSGQ